MTTNKTTRLSDSQLVILNHAARQEDGRVLPLPERLGSKGTATRRTLTSLLKRRLIAECPAAATDQIWRMDGEQRVALVITPAGLEALGVKAEPDHPQQPASAPSTTSDAVGSKQSSPEKQKKVPAFRPGTKGAAIMALLERRDGATLSEITEASGWQAHSVRGFISGTVKNKHGIAVSTLTDGDGLRRYRLDQRDA